jgi:3'-phosphoadenosine 5'-phosphosulfate sulfotransferase (PAPS reductase)/FAD synthetase
VKVNPLATWGDDDVDGYVRDRGLPTHPLANQQLTGLPGDRGRQGVVGW